MKNRKPRADGGYIVNVSFTAQEKNLLDHADAKGNFSHYIKRLIIADMDNKQINQSSDVLELLVKALENSNFKNNINNQAKKEVLATKEEKKEEKKIDKKAIGNIMNIMK